MTPIGSKQLITNCTEGPAINVIAFIHADGQHYYWFYEDGLEPETIQSIGRAAANPTLSFGWDNAARLAQRIRARQKT